LDEEDFITMWMKRGHLYLMIQGTLPMMEYMSFIYIKLWKMKFMKKKSIFFLYFQYEENYLFIKYTPPLHFFSLIFGKKKEKKELA